MKKSTNLIIAFTAFALSASATIRTVNNNLNGPGIFSSIQAAHDAATSGDTIFLAASPSGYAGAVFSKKIALFGAGMRPIEKKDNAATSFLNSSISLISGSDGSQIVGINFNGRGLNIDNNVSNCQLLRNYFTNGCNMVQFNGGSYSGWLIANNFFNQDACCCTAINGQNQTFTNFLIQNNVFTDNTGCDCGDFVLRGFGSTANCIFSNNLVYSNSAGDVAFGSVSNFIIENNIFHTASPGGASNCVMNNNITFGTNQNTLPYGSNSGLNNVSNTDPQLTSFSNAIKNPFQNFQPAAGPAKTGGVSGTQMGVYGGGFNWNNSAVSPIPAIRSFSITSGSTVPSGGSVNIKVTATKQN
jgi:parallel beta-helix repeat protein